MTLKELKGSIGRNDFILYYKNSVSADNRISGPATMYLAADTELLDVQKHESECIGVDLRGNTSEPEKCFNYYVAISEEAWLLAVDARKTVIAGRKARTMRVSR